MLTRNICSEYGAANIQCNGIGPGYIATPVGDVGDVALGVNALGGVIRQSLVQMLLAAAVEGDLRPRATGVPTPSLPGLRFV